MLLPALHQRTIGCKDSYPTCVNTAAVLAAAAVQLTLKCSISRSCGVNIHASHSGCDGSSQKVNMPNNTLGMPSTMNSHCLCNTSRHAQESTTVTSLNGEVTVVRACLALPYASGGRPVCQTCLLTNRQPKMGLPNDNARHACNYMGATESTSKAVSWTE